MYNKLRISTKRLIKKYVQVKDSVINSNNDNKNQSHAFSFGEHELVRQPNELAIVRLLP